jgi:hypothetical protein
VIYDLDSNIRFTVTESWDRSPAEITVGFVHPLTPHVSRAAHPTEQFSADDSFIYLTAGDEAKVKIFALPVPPTPSESSTNPPLDANYTTPVPLTHSRASSAIHILPNERLLSHSHPSHPLMTFSSCTTSRPLKALS